VLSLDVPGQSHLHLFQQRQALQELDASIAQCEQRYLRPDSFHR
jgi:hypothetical protein